MRALTHHRNRPVTATAKPHRRGLVSRTSGEAGVILPIVAMSTISFLLLATLVIDGSHAYSQRRNMQNAADASALAAARAFDTARTAGAGWGTVNQTAVNVAADNGAESSTCQIINPNGVILGSCTQIAALTSQNAAGVRVEAVDVRPTTFPVVIDKESVTARASASATIQTFSGGTGVPFIICGNPAVGGYPILGPDGRINPVTATAMGSVPIQGSQVPTCGAGSAFKGKIDQNFVIDQLPASVRGDNGNGYEADIAVQVLGANACTDEDMRIMEADGAVDCEMILPVADQGWGNGNNIGLRGVAWAVFHVTGNGQGNPKYYGEFVGTNAYIVGGRTTIDIPGPGVPRSIRLID